MRSAIFVPACLAALCQAGIAKAQSADLTVRVATVDVASEVVRNDADHTRVLFDHLVVVPEAGSIQLTMGRTKLPEGCTLRLTSLRDGAAQHHTGETLKQWQGHSAWLNGRMVHVELVAQPGSGPAHVHIDSASWLQLMDTDRSICGNTDDRVLSDDARAGRHFPIGCTTWLIDDANHTFISAGHCVDGGISGDVVQFNVPLSDPDGDWNHPGPEDQYAVDPESLQSHYVQIGNDWAYYGCFPNTETGLTPFQAQGDYYVLADTPPPVTGQPITITGFGSVSSPVNPQWNLVQKTHTGPFAYNSDTSIGYVTDTSGGNSGSAVFDEDTQTAIGIHTNGGCSSGHNWGCAIHNAGLQYALANPQGVCIPNIILLGFPDGRPTHVPAMTPTEVVFTAEPGEETPLPETIALMLTVDGQTQQLTGEPLGNHHYAVTFPPLACDGIVSFHLRAQGDGGTVVHHPHDAPDNEFSLAIGELIEVEMLAESFDGGLPAGWTASGLWHGSGGECAPAHDCGEGDVMYFGQDGDCDYDTGSTEAGVLSTGPISLQGIAGDLVLTYCSTLETEDLSDWDYAAVLVNGVEVDRADESSGWQTRTVELGDVTGDTITIAWSFDTGDEQYNDYIGWHIDSARLTANGVECEACPGDADGSGDVGTDDLLMIIADWGQSGSDADVDGNGTVGASDILLVLAGWGPC